MKLFVVGEYFGEHQGLREGKPYDYIVWEFHGVFDNEELALKACIRDNFFIGPVNLNQELPDEPENWPGCYFPKEEKEI